MPYKPDLKKTYENMLANPEAFTTTGKTESNTESQERRILAYLKSGKTLTHKQAEGLFDSSRLSARVHRLNKRGRLEGWEIKATMIKTYSGKRIARYSYEPSGE